MRLGSTKDCRSRGCRGVSLDAASNKLAVAKESLARSWRWVRRADWTRSLCWGRKRVQALPSPTAARDHGDH